MKCSFKLSKRSMKVDKLGRSKMSMRMSMSVSWITSYSYKHGTDATRHLEPMEWVKFLARNFASGHWVQTNLPTFFKQKCHFLSGSVHFFLNVRTPFKISRHAPGLLYHFHFVFFCK